MSRLKISFVSLIGCFCLLVLTDMLTLSTLANNVRCFSLNLLELLLNIAASLKNGLAFESESVLPFARLNAPTTEPIMPIDYFAKGKGTQPVLVHRGAFLAQPIWRPSATPILVADGFAGPVSHLNSNSIEFINKGVQTYFDQPNNKFGVRSVLLPKNEVSPFAYQNKHDGLYIVRLPDEFSTGYPELPGKIGSHYALVQDIEGSGKSLLVVATTSLKTPELVLADPSPCITIDYSLKMELLPTIPMAPEPLCGGYVDRTGELPLDPVTGKVPQKLAQKIMTIDTAQIQGGKIKDAYMENIIHNKYKNEIAQALNELIKRQTAPTEELVTFGLRADGFRI